MTMLNIGAFFHGINNTEDSVSGLFKGTPDFAVRLAISVGKVPYTILAPDAAALNFKRKDAQLGG